MDGEDAELAETRPHAFDALEWLYDDTRHPRAMAFVAALPDGLHDPAQLNGEHVIIDGKHWRVAGTESFAVARGPGYPYRGPFGLAVEEIPPEGLRVPLS
jgi:hypothetical protein